MCKWAMIGFSLNNDCMVEKVVQDCNKVKQNKANVNYFFPQVKTTIV